MGLKFSNQQGNITLVVMMVMTVTGITALTSAMTVQQIQKVDRIARVKGQMAAVEANLKMRLHQTYAYENCDTAVGPESCRLRESYFNDLLVTSVQTNQCPDGDPAPPCGIVVEDLNFTATPSPRITARIRYTPVDLSVAPIDVDIEPPFEILQSEGEENVCLNGLFRGYDPMSGRIICEQPISCTPARLLMRMRPNLDASCRTFPNRFLPDEADPQPILAYVTYYIQQHLFGGDTSHMSPEEQTIVNEAIGEYNDDGGGQTYTGTGITRPIHPMDWWRN